MRSILPKKQDSETKKKSSYTTAMEHIKMINSSIKSLNRIKVTESKDTQNSKIREGIESTIESLKELLNEYTQADGILVSRVTKKNRQT